MSESKTMEMFFKEAMQCKDREDAAQWLHAEAEEEWARTASYTRPGNTREIHELEATMKSNLAYHAGYYSWEARQRIFDLFGAAHPVFGHRQVTSEEAFNLGLEMGTRARKEAQDGA